jgi:L-propargylglycine--L-glutamate ligase
VTPEPRSVRVALYSVAYNAGLVERLPYVRHFGERCLCHLGDLARPGSRVVLVTPSPIPDDIIDYHLRDVLGFDAEQALSARTRLVQLSPRPRAAQPLADLVLHDVDLCDRIRREVESADEAVLTTIAPSPVIDRLEASLGVRADEGPLGPARRWGSKSGGKALFAATGVPTFRGRPEALFSVDDVTAAALRLARASPPAERVVVKLDDVGWSAGVGNAVVNCGELLRTGSLGAAIETAMQPWDRLEVEIAQAGAIVEEYLVGGSSSPSGQGEIDGSGAVSVRATHEQSLDGGHYLGCTYPSRPEFRHRITGVVRRIGDALADEGIRGTFGVDFVGYDDGRLLATEVNVRKLGASHVMAYVEAAVRDRLDPSGGLQTSGRPLSYVHRRVYRPDSLAGLAVATAVARLRRRDLLWKADTGPGALLHILGGLASCGYVETTSVASSPDEALALDAEVQAALAGHPRPRPAGD